MTDLPPKTHNKPKAGGIAGEQLLTIIERIERLENEKSGIAADIRDIFAEAKGAGFDVKTIKQVLKIRAMDEAAREEQETLLDTYLHALGMLSDTPLGQAALRAEGLS